MAIVAAAGLGVFRFQPASRDEDAGAVIIAAMVLQCLAPQVTIVKIGGAHHIASLLCAKPNGLAELGVERTQLGQVRVEAVLEIGFTLRENDLIKRGHPMLSQQRADQSGVDFGIQRCKSDVVGGSRRPCRNLRSAHGIEDNDGGPPCLIGNVVSPCQRIVRVAMIAVRGGGGPGRTALI